MAAHHVHGPGPTGPAREVLHLAGGVELLGPQAGSGYRTPPHLVRRADGQTLQLSPLLARILEAIRDEGATRGEGGADPDRVAAAVSDAVGRELTGGDVTWLAAHRLRPLGVLRMVDGSEPSTTEHRSVLGLRGRVVLAPPSWTAALSRPLLWLFHAPVVVAVVAAFAALSAWTLLDKGLGDPIDAALGDPGLLLLVVAATIASAAFHELGHAAACRYGGARPGAIGAAVYLVWPVFYTDVTDSYRLPRADRLRVDLGGLYFNALFTLGVGAAWAATGAEGLLVLVPLQLLQMLRQLVPVVRFDGYHILADLVGVPDLFARIGPTLAGALPGRRAVRDANPLRPAAQAVVVTWVAVVVPVLIVALVLLVWTLPDLVVRASATLGRQAELFGANLARGDAESVALGIVAMATVAFVPLSALYLLGRVGGRGARRFWSATRGHTAHRAVGFAVLAGLLLGAGPQLASVPREAVLAATGGASVHVEDPDPVGVLAAPGPDTQPTQGGTFAGADLRTGHLPRTDALARGDLRAEGHVGALQVGSDAARAHSRWVDRRGAAEVAAEPRRGTTAAPASPAPRAEAQQRPTPSPMPILGSEDAWPFAFERPVAPREHDRQVVVVNQTDGASRFDLATDLVWEDGDVLDSRNEAWALASCVACRTVAAAFQVVASTAPTRTAIPQNHAVAANVDCDTCVTRAVAVQLAVTLDSVPDHTTRIDVATVVAAVASRRAAFATMEPDAILAELHAAKAEVLRILGPYVTQGAEDPRADEDGTSTPPPAGSIRDQAAEVIAASDGAVHAAPSSSPRPVAVPEPTAVDANGGEATVDPAAQVDPDVPQVEDAGVEDAAVDAPTAEGQATDLAAVGAAPEATGADAASEPAPTEPVATGVP